MCSEPRSLNGRHLLQCPALPANLLEARAKLLDEHYPDLSLAEFAQRVVECYGAHLHNDERNSSTDSWLQSLALGRKIARFAKSTLTTQERLLSERELADLFAPPSEELPAGRYPIVGGQLSSLGVIDDSSDSDGAQIMEDSDGGAPEPHWPPSPAMPSTAGRYPGYLSSLGVIEDSSASDGA